MDGDRITEYPLECQSFEKRKFAGYLGNCIPRRDQALGQIKSTYTYEARKYLIRTELVSKTRTWTSFSDFTRGVCISHILSIETYFAEVLYTGEFISDFIEVHGLDFNGPIGRTKDDKFLPPGPVDILYVFRKKCSYEGCPVVDRGCLPNE